MSTQAPISTNAHRPATKRLLAAGFICILILATTIPDLGSIALPDHTIGYGWKDAAAIAIIVAPLILIFIGAACSRVAEYIGWALLLILFLLRFIG